MRSKKNKSNPYLFPFALLIALIFISSNVFFQEIRSFLLLEAENSLKEVAQQCSVALENKLDSHLEVLSSLANLEEINKENLLSPNNLRLLRKEVGRSGFIRIGISDMDGNAHTTDGQSFSIADRFYFRQAKAGIPTLSDNLHDRIEPHKNRTIVVHAVPIKNAAGETRGVMFATDLAAQLTDLLQNIYSGPPRNVYILSREGTILVAGKNAKKSSGQNLFTQIEDPSDSSKLNRLRNQLATDEAGSAAYASDNDEMIVGIARVAGTSQWYIAVTSPRNTVMAQAQKIMFRVKCLLLAVILSLCGGLRYFFHLNKKYLKEKENARYFDLQLQMKNTFIANVSHEIRTPINAITGMTHLLGKTELNDVQRTYLCKIKTASTILLGIINDILDISKITSGNLRLSNAPFHLSGIIASLDSLFADKIHEKKLQWNIHADDITDTYLCGDAQRLTQILINLINNAYKFTEHGEITLSIRTIPTPNPAALQCAFSVKDTGPGIAEKDLEKLFAPFEQLESTLSKTYEGTGLGLSISKNLVAAMGGVLSVHSRPNAGAEFSFVLDFLKTNAPIPTQEAAIQDTAADAAHIAACRILLVEDNEINAEIAGALLDELGASYDWAENGQKAVDMCRQTRYDLILMDIHMPVLNGYEAAKILKETLQIRAPIIALTATSIDLEKYSAEENHIETCILKPFQPDQFKKIVHSYLRNRNSCGAKQQAVENDCSNLPASQRS